MDSSDVIQLLVLVVLLSLSAFFSSSETALTTVNKIRVRSLAESGDQRAIILTKVIEEQGKMLSAILIGNNLVNLSASSLMTTLTIKLLGSKAVGIATGILTLLILVFGEITPKTLSTISAEKISLKNAKIIKSFPKKYLGNYIYFHESIDSGDLCGQQNVIRRSDPDACGSQCQT